MNEVYLLFENLIWITLKAVYGSMCFIIRHFILENLTLS